MICGKGVKQDDGWSIAHNRICDLGISATNAIHAQILNARVLEWRASPPAEQFPPKKGCAYGFVACCPCGTGRYSGSSGMTIHATM